MTAKEFLKKYLKNNPEGKYDDCMIEFAKYHVEQALKEASKTNRIDLYVRPDVKGSKYKKIESGESYDLLGTRQMWKINKDSILNAYPLTLIL
jgi:hypothetical protein